MFEEWLEEEPHGLTITDEDKTALLGDLEKARDKKSVDTFSELTNLRSFGALQKLFSDFLQHQQSSLARLWLSYMDMVSLLLCFIRAGREGDWSDHLSSVGELLPWMFAYDRTNYSRYLSLYWCQMHLLETTRPLVYQQLNSGEFCVQRGTNPFSQIPVDQAIEQTINPHTKTKGGIIGFSQ